jgi:hypothetical protein
MNRSFSIPPLSGYRQGTGVGTPPGTDRCTAHPCLDSAPTGDASVVLAGLSTGQGPFITPGTGLQGFRDGRLPSFFLVETAGPGCITGG